MISCRVLYCQAAESQEGRLSPWLRVASLMQWKIKGMARLRRRRKIMDPDKNVSEGFWQWEGYAVEKGRAVWGGWRIGEGRGGVRRLRSWFKWGLDCLYVKSLGKAVGGMVQLLMDDFKVPTLFPAFCFDILIIWLLIHSLIVLYSVRNSVFLC